MTYDIEESEYVKLCKDFFLPYYTNVDDGHGIEHVTEVVATALAINNKLELKLNPLVLILAGYAHDMYSFTNRDAHHEYGMAFIFDGINDVFEERTLGGRGKVLKYLTDSELYLAGKAVAEHRASFKGEYHSMYSEVISAADRGAPVLSSIAKRVHVCSKDTRLVFKTDDMELTENSTEEEFLLRTYTHIKEKYSRVGYCRYNDIYRKYYNSELEAFYVEIDNLTMESLNNILNN